MGAGAIQNDIDGPLSAHRLRADALAMVVRGLVARHPDRDAIKADIEAALTVIAAQFPEQAGGVVQGLRVQLRGILPE